MFDVTYVVEIGPLTLLGQLVRNERYKHSDAASRAAGRGGGGMPPPSPAQAAVGAKLAALPTRAHLVTRMLDLGADRCALYRMYHDDNQVAAMREGELRLGMGAWDMFVVPSALEVIEAVA